MSYKYILDIFITGIDSVHHMIIIYEKNILKTKKGLNY